MATQTLSVNTSPIQRALQADGILCAVMGAAFTLGADAFSSFMGVESSGLLLAMGLFLLVYGGGLFYMVTYRPIDRRLPMIVIELNIAWVIGSILLLAADPLTMTTEGRWFVLILADVVAGLAIWQFIARRRAA